MAGRGRPAMIYRVYDRQKKLVFTGTAAQIAHRFCVSPRTVHQVVQRGGRMLWEYEIVPTKETVKCKAEGRKKMQHYVHDIYKVIDMKTGEVVYRGSVQDIADKYFVTTRTIYQIVSGKSKTLLREYTLEYDGKEASVK